MQSDDVLAVLSHYGVKAAKFDEPLSRHTTWRIGGPADVFVTPTSVEGLQGVLRAAAQLDLPWTVIGRGSNLLVQDGGIRGLVIKLQDQFAEITVDGTQLTAQSGRSVVSAANIAIKHDLGGLEFATGIPGSVGGAVMMNAGANGSEVKDALLWAEVMDSNGSIHRLSNTDLQFRYRYSILRERPLIVLKAAFGLYPANGLELREKVQAWTRRRADTQPLSMPSCGSVFRNPPGTYAGQLVELAGLKGLRHRNAQVSEKHANFIVNLGGAKAADVLWLMRHVQDTVRDKFSVNLETEVRIVGEPTSGR